MKRLLLGVSLALNLAVLVGAAWAASGGSFQMIVRFFIQPAHERWTSQFDEIPVQPGDVVFLGDSITEGGAWHELFPGVPLRNRGIGGDTTAGVLARLSQVTSGHPGKVFLLIGTNDLHAGVSGDEIVRNVDRILGRIQTESPNTRSHVQSILPRAAEWQVRVESLNRSLEAVAKARGAGWIDLYPLFLNDFDGSIRDDMSNDELHLLGRGYLVWRDHIDALVRH